MSERAQAFYEHVSSMTEEERKMLDPVCDALDAYFEKACDDRAYVVPNRAAALCAIKAVVAFVMDDCEDRLN